MTQNPHQIVMSRSRLRRVRDFVIVFYRNLPHIMNMRVLNRAMRDKQIARDFDSIEGLAVRIKCSRSTVSRFFSGRNTSLAITLRILEALDLDFGQVFMEVGPALLARLQAHGVAYEHSEATVLDPEVLTWPEASGIREHLGLQAQAPGSDRQASSGSGER